MFSQPGSSGGFGNTIPQFCNCVTFKYACTDQTASFSNGGITSRCNSPNFQFPLTFSPFGPRDSTYCRANCPEGSREGICLISGNWHICDFNGCDARIYQTLSNFPTINGQLVGSGAGVGSTGGTGTCIGPIYAGPLNNINSRTKLNLCPGDEATLTLPQLDIPPESGLCLEVSIKDLNDQVIVDNIYTYQDVALGSIDITNLLGALDHVTVYVIEMTLRCCSDVQTCTNNTFKSAYIELTSPLVYTSNLAQGGGDTQCDYFDADPSPQFPGPSFITPLEIDLSLPNPIIRNCPVILAVNALNNPDSLELNITLNRIENCNLSDERWQVLTISVIPDSQAVSQPVVSNKISDECECYELVFSYEGCDGQPVEEVYYFQVGDDCLPNIHDDEVQWLNTANNGKIQTRPNPVVNELIIDIQDMPDNVSHYFDLMIVDMNGRQVHSAQVPAVKGSVSIPLNVVSGVYLYILSSGDYVTRGKFVKQ